MIYYLFWDYFLGDELMPHICNMCDNRFASMVAWRTHMRRFHEINVLNDDTNVELYQGVEKMEDGAAFNFSSEAKPLQGPKVKRHCPAEMCSFVTYFGKELLEHIQFNHDNRPYSCKKCGKSFKKASHLRAHDAEVHLGVRPHVCETCGFSFGRKTNLIKHQRNNACPAMKKSSNDNIITNETTIGTSEQRVLADGTVIEANAVPEDHKFLCHQCHKSFKYRQSLQYHIERWIMEFLTSGYKIYSIFLLK